MAPFNEAPSPVVRQQRISAAASDFPKHLLLIENVGDEHPESSGDCVLNEMLLVRLAVSQPPPEGEVVGEDLVAHVHQDRVHAWGNTAGYRLNS